MGAYDAMSVTVPEGSAGALRVERFTVTDNSFANFRLGWRSTRPGTYTKLMDSGRVWMSDTPVIRTPGRLAGVMGESPAGEQQEGQRAALPVGVVTNQNKEG
jgi:hypothetical protein